MPFSHNNDENNNEKWVCMAAIPTKLPCINRLVSVTHVCVCVCVCVCVFAVCSAVLKR